MPLESLHFLYFKTICDHIHILHFCDNCHKLHPYVYPVNGVDFASELHQIVILQPYSIRGSLKDQIYNSKVDDYYDNKYSHKGSPLPLASIQVYGRQILEALLFLYSKGLPSFSHLHTGNILLHGGACRLSGLENSIIGYEPKIHPLLSAAGSKRQALKHVDSICFGHVLFEMSCGFELDRAQPGPTHLHHVAYNQIVEILNYIFGPDAARDHCPTIQEISELSFFSVIKPVELEQYNPAPIHMTSAMKSLLRAKPSSGDERKRRRKSSSAAGSSRKASRSRLVDETSFTAHSGSSGSRGDKPNTIQEIRGDLPVPPAPPAPPPPAPAPTPTAGAAAGPGERTALLASIRQGTSLRKTETNRDRSAPIL